MKRINVIYDGRQYSIGNCDLEALEKQIEDAVREGFGWLDLNDGDAAVRPARLLITSAAQIALIPIED